MTEPKRITAFRLAIAKQIPKFPNDKTSLQALEAKSLGSLLIDYANWAIRYIAPRSRTVVVEQSTSSDPRWQSLGADIQALLKKAEDGDDLTPHLSPQTHRRGFTPAASVPGPNVNRWADKDMLLNVMGYHHLHLDAAPSNQMRSDDVLFAHVTRDLFTVVGIFNHTVFEATQPNAAMTAERDRLWKIFDERSTRGVAPGQIVATSIALSGHSLTQLPARYARVVTELDPKLDDVTYVRGLYEKARVPVPAKPKVRWHLIHLTLGLADELAGVFFPLCIEPSVPPGSEYPAGPRG
jgi:hypothetical protein